MPPSISSRLQEVTLDLVWSLWVELGVSGWTRRHTDWAIDPEPLILFTAALGDADQRLRDESTDWCIRYHRYVSVARLRNLLRDTWSDVGDGFGEYAATVNAHARAGWPQATVPRPYRPTGRSKLEDFRRPALLVLRLRALFGVTARADLVGTLVAQPDRDFATADLAEAVGFTKRSVQNELEALRLAGLVESVLVRNQRRNRLARRNEVLAFLAPCPSHFPRWNPFLRILFAGGEVLLRTETLAPMVQAVEAKRTLRSLEGDLRRAGIAPPRDVQGAAFCDAFATWVLDLAEHLANAPPPVDPMVARPRRQFNWDDGT